MKKRRNRRRALFVSGMALLFTAVSTPAATITVNSPADSGGTCPGVDCTLRQAIATAASGDTINFAPGLATITLTSGELLINQAVTINGPGANLLTVQRDSAAINFRVFETAFVSLFSNITISGLTISNGSSTAGGGIYASRETLAITNCIISNNTATTGGGLYTDPNAQVTITNSTFSGNTAVYGGGIYNVGAGSVTLIASTISGNSVTGASDSAGGGIYNLGTATITNSTFSGNSAQRSGGGIWNNFTVNLTNSTISGNKAPGAAAGGGGVYNLKTVNSSNTIIARNTATTAGPDVDGAFTSQGYNVIGDSSGSSGFTNGTNNDQVGTAPTVLDPKLDVLKDNGGPTFTQALQATSPAINKGKSNGSTTDQRGFARPVFAPGTAFPSGGDGSDIGAYEVQADQLAGCSDINRVVNTKNDSVAGSLRSVITSVCAGSTITFAADVRGAISLTGGQITIDKNLTISGPGANLLTVERDASVATARIFSIATSRNVTISGLTISNGTAPGDHGGGILNSGTLTLLHDTVSLNSAIGGNGGGIYSSGTLSVVGSTISGNKIDSSTAGSGGGIFNFGGTITVSNSTVSGNSAVSGGTTDHGGGIYSNVGSVTITSSTISANKADNGGGVLGENGAVIKAKSSIIALNTAPSGPDMKGPLTSQGFNIFGSTSGATITAPPAPAVDQVGAVQLNLGGLQDNGGPTFTHALMPGSTAIDQGNSGGASADQRGFARAVDFSSSANPAGGDGSDVGAFEYEGVPPGVTTGAATDITSTTATLNASVNPNGLDSFANFILEASSLPAQDAGSGSADVPVQGAVSGLAPGTQYHYHAVATNSAGTTTGVVQTFTTLPAPTPTPTATPTPTPTPNPTGLANVSTRLRIETGDNVLFAGFIVTGTEPKKIIVLGTGPSLTAQGVPGALANPTLELYQGDTLIDSNDNWVDSPNKQAIIDSGVAPTDDLESAIVATLPANDSQYTAIVRGVGNGTGVGTVQLFDLDRSVDSKLANISTRGFVQTGDNILIAGTIVLGQTTQKIIVRAIGPSLSVPGKLADPTLELRDGNGGLLDSNDNWKDSPDKQAIIDSTVPPTNDLESAIVATLSSNGAQYTAVVRGVNGTTGVAVVEVYTLN